MTSSITTMLVYILLYIEYLFLYPNAEPWLNAALCYLLLLGTIVYNVIYQSVWLACPKMKKKLLTNSILFSNLVAMLLIFMVEPLWEISTNTWSISIILGSIMIVHMMFVSIQQWYVYKNRIRWKEEYQFLKTITMNIEEIKYEKFLKRYLKFAFYFSLLYLFIGYDLISIVLIIIHFLYSVYLYNLAWEKGFMFEVIYDNQKWHFYALLVITSFIVILLNNYIPTIIAVMIITCPEMVLRIYLQRYMYRLISEEIVEE